jgi:hypothetical protein
MFIRSEHPSASIRVIREIRGQKIPQRSKSFKPPNARNTRNVCYYTDL